MQGCWISAKREHIAFMQINFIETDKQSIISNVSKLIEDGEVVPAVNEGKNKHNIKKGVCETDLHTAF